MNKDKDALNGEIIEKPKSRQGQGGGVSSRVFTEKEIIEVKAVACVLSTEQIADYFGVSQTNFYEIMKRQPEVKESYKKGKAIVIKEIGHSLLQKARDGDTLSQIFYLKTRGKWREKHEVEHTTRVLEYSKEDLEKLSTEELKLMKDIHIRLSDGKK